MPFLNARQPYLLLTVAALLFHATSHAAIHEFRFFPISNGAAVNNLQAGTVIDGAFQMDVIAAPSGATLHVGTAGVGVDTNDLGNSNVVDNDTDKISILEGADPNFSGSSEAVLFSFNRDGGIRDLLLNGLKDENLEYAILELPDSSLLTFFDSEVPVRLAEQGFSVSDLTAPNINFLTDGDDDLLGVNLPFLAGETFKLTFAVHPAPVRQGPSGPVTYVPADPQAPNGFQLQALFVVPEPSALLLSMAGLAWIAVNRQR